MPFCNQNGKSVRMYETGGLGVGIPFWMQKGSKIKIKLELKNMDQNLSNDAFKSVIRGLD